MIFSETGHTFADHALGLSMIFSENRSHFSGSCSGSRPGAL